MRWLCSILAVMFLSPSLVYPAPSGATNGPVCIIEIREDITHNTIYLVRRALNEAAAKGAAAVILEMDTNGGRVDATEKIVRLLEHAPAKTYTFVNKKAFSAGAYISAATDKIFMAPASVIGDAKPILMIPGQGVQETPKSYEEKLNSAMRALIRTTAQVKGHNPDVFEAMVDADKELVIDGVTINPKDKLLTLTTDEAARTYGKPPKPLLSAGTVKSVEELLEKVGLPGAETFTVRPTGFEVLGRWLTFIGPVLLMIGFVAIYLELKAPGLGAPTAVAVIAFGLYFTGSFIAGLAGWEIAALFLIGLMLLSFEILFPGHLVPGIVGTTLMLVALVLAITERMPGRFTLPTFPALQIPVVKVAAAFTASLVVMAILARYLPKTAVYRRMELGASTSTALGYTSAKGEAQELLGTQGIAETMLRPAGKGRFGDKLVDVVTEGDLIERGATIKITQVQGAHVVVERVTS